MIEKAYGKINLSIDVVGKREDGYHDLDMIMLPIDLYDIVDIEIIDGDKDQYKCNVDLPYDEKNIIYKCIDLLRKECGFKEHFKINIEKNIPACAGLAGGSADGAATMRILNQLLNLNLSFEQLVDLGKQIGADIPFCLFSKPARVKGIGEIIKPLDIGQDYDVLLIKPEDGINTGLAFKNLDLSKCEHPDMDNLETAFVQHESYHQLLGNSLQYSGFDLCPEVKKIIDECKDLGFENTLMTGSGSTVFVISDKERLEELYDTMEYQYHFVCLTKVLCFSK